MSIYLKKYQDNDIFNLRRNRTSLNLNLTTKPRNGSRCELQRPDSIVDSKMREHSPYINGIRNEKFVPPHFISKICIGTSHEEKNEKNFTGEELPARNNEQKVCNHCINRELAKSKEKKNVNKTYDDIGNPRELQEKMNILHKRNIAQKIQDRMNMSELVGTSIKSMQEKEKLIESTEKKTFFLFEANADPLKERTIERYKLKELMQNKLKKVPKEKPEITQYYEKCVINCEPEDPYKCYNNPYIPPRKQYVSELDKQVNNKMIENERHKRMERQVESEILEKTREQIKRQSYDCAIQKKKIKDEFITYNANLAIIKQRKQESAKTKCLTEEKANAHYLQTEYEKIKKEEKEKNFNSKMGLLRSLNMQIDEKKKMTEQTKLLDRVNERKSIANNCACNCNCDGLDTCTLCKRRYPKEFLNPKDVFKRIAMKNNYI